MKYYDINKKLILCPYGLRILAQRIERLDKTVLLMPLIDYVTSTVDASAYNMIFLYEWSGFCPAPTQLANNVFVFHFNYTVADNVNIFYYPQWLFCISEAIRRYSEPDTTFPLACASRNFNNGRPGKIYNLQLLKSKPYYNDILITKFKSIESFELYSLPEMSDDTFKQLVNEFLLDYNTWQTMDSPELTLGNSMTTIDLDVYKKSLFSIIAETSVHHTFLSEKTFKVFAAGQIPIMCGPQGAIMHLKQLGFDVFDDIVDHSYDNISNWQERIIAMHKSLDSIVKLDHNTILIETHNRRISNFRQLHSVELHNKLLEPMIKRIAN